MRIIFFGTSEFATSALKAIVKAGHTVSSVVTQPLRQKGRGLKASAQAVEEQAKELALRVLRFDDVNSEEAVESLKDEQAEAFVVAAFGQILSSRVLEIPALCAVNIHASLLPKYRGAAPIQWALINGEKITGVTIIRMNEKLDEGDIIAQQELKISDDEDAASLSRKLSLLGAGLVVHALSKIGTDTIFQPQDGSAATYAPKLTKKDGLIDWRKDAVSIKNLVRGCYPWPSAYTYLNKRLLKVLEVKVIPGIEDASSGKIIMVDNEGILVGCAGGAVLIKRLQLEGKKALTAEKFLRGNRVTAGTLLE